MGSPDLFLSLLVATSLATSVAVNPQKYSLEIQEAMAGS